MVNPTKPPTVPSLEDLKILMGSDNLITLGDQVCIAVDKHVAVVREVIEYGEGRMKTWMTLLICIFCFAICVVYYFMNKDIQYYKAKYENLKAKQIDSKEATKSPETAKGETNKDK